MKKLIALFFLILPFTVYGFSLLVNFNLVQSLFASSLPFSTICLILLRVPLWSFSPIAETFSYFLLLNTLLSTLYVALIITTIQQRRKERALYGLSGSLLGILSIGCVTCGALFPPFAFLVATLGIPMSVLGTVSISLSVLGSGLLLVGNFYLYRNFRMHT